MVGRRYPLAIEAGGTLNAHLREFLRTLAVASFPSLSERAVFLAFALQRPRAVSLKEFRVIILARPVSRAPLACPQTWGPGLDWTEAAPYVPRPLYLRPLAHNHGRCGLAGAFPDAPLLSAPLPAPSPASPVGVPPHRVPQLPGLNHPALLVVAPPSSQVAPSAGSQRWKIKAGCLERGR